MNFEFNVEEHMDTSFYRKILNCMKYPNLITKLKDDILKNKIENKYSSIIKLYSSIDLKELDINEDCILNSFDKIISAIKYTNADNETGCMQNISNILIMKYLFNVVEKTKDMLDSKLNDYFEELTKRNVPKKTPYYDLLKKTMTKLFYSDNNVSVSNFSISDYEMKPRPETAKPSYLKNLELNNKNTNVSCKSSYERESKRNNNYNSSRYKKNSLITSNDESIPSSPTFQPDYKHIREKPKEIEFITNNCVNNHRANRNLTNNVWPRSKTLLSIVSKMFLEYYINEEQRGLLKELIMDYDDKLMQILNEYEISGDCIRLYECIINLTQEKKSLFYDK